VTTTALSRAGAAPTARRRSLDRFELTVLAVFVLLSLWVVGSDLIQTLVQERRWTHTDGFFSNDQLQYLAWIQSSAHHGLISDFYVLRPTPADYLQPAIMLSGLLVRLGVASWLALMLWKPVAVVGIFLAVRALAHATLDRRFDRRAALVLGLLFCSITVVGGSVGVFGDMVNAWQSWGYPFGLIGVALITFALIGYARAREQGRITLVPGLLGALAALVHPWQGELMILVVAGTELVRAPQTRRRLAGSRLAIVARDPAIVMAALTLVLVVVPLLYYLSLGHLDAVWRMARQHSRHVFEVSPVLIGAAPLLAFALLGYRGRPDDLLELELRVWIPAVVALWLFSMSVLGATPQHTINGITLPMAILAVKGARRAGLVRLPRARALATLAIAVGVVPGTAYMLAYAHTYTNPATGNADYITAGESHALDWLAADRVPGGVLSGFYLGEAIPGITGRQDYVGDCLWSQPGCFPRSDAANALLRGRMAPARARRFVIATGARFVVGACDAARPRVARELAPLLAATRTFGCATVWQLRAPSARS
jgi:hypothetical protein